MANVLPREQQITVLQHLVEGNTLRSTSRLTGTHRTTIQRLLLAFGERCLAFMDRELRGLRLTHLETDEMWTFAQKKQGRLRDGGRGHGSGVDIRRSLRRRDGRVRFSSQICPRPPALAVRGPSLCADCSSGFVYNWLGFCTLRKRKPRHYRRGVVSGLNWRTRDAGF